MVEPLDLISAAPIWIRKETGTCTSRKYVTFPPDQLLTLPLVACIDSCTHEYTHQRGKKEVVGGGCRELCNQVISLL